MCTLRFWGDGRGPGESSDAIKAMEPDYAEEKLILSFKMTGKTLLRMAALGFKTMSTEG